MTTISDSLRVGEMVVYPHTVGDIESGETAEIIAAYGVGSYLVKVASGREYYAHAGEIVGCTPPAEPTDEQMAALKARWEREEREPTPLPWMVEHGKQYDDSPLAAIVGENGDTVADNRQYYPHAVKVADMETIVRAVNAHDALVAALQNMVDADELTADDYEQANAALALARNGER